MYVSLLDQLPEEILNTGYYLDGSDDPISLFGPIKPVNIFVGANNSGKSRLMRGLLKADKLWVHIAAINIEKNISVIVNWIENLTQKYNTPNGNFSFNIILNQTPNYLIGLKENSNPKNQGTRLELDSIFGNKYYTGNVISILSELKTLLLNHRFDSLKINAKIEAFIIATLYWEYYWDHLPLRNEMDRKLYPVMNKIADIARLTKEIYDADVTLLSVKQKVYIPVIRSNTLLTNQPNGRFGDDIFSKTIEANYKLSLSKCLIHTGQKFYDDITNHKSHEDKHLRKNFKQFEGFVSEYFFSNKSIEITAVKDKNVIKIDIADEERTLPDIGDGINALLCLLYPIFMSQKGSWLFIEEPEINLHPGLQRLFIQQILENDIIRDKKLVIFFTTHSNHLVDLVIDHDNVSIFSFEKLASTKHRIRNANPGDIGVLRQLGVNNSSVFMANCSIWVEGISDRLYLSSYLQAYINHHPRSKKFLQDTHYSFFEYSGSNVAHYFFSQDIPELEAKDKIEALRLSNRIYLIADMDKDKEAKHTILHNQTSSQFHYEALAVREVENLLSPKQMEIAFPKVFPEFKKEIDFTLLKQEDYSTVYLGSYLASIYGDHIFLPSYKSKSGSISSNHKPTLSREVAQITNWENMSPKAKELAQNIYNFIAANNTE